MRLFLVLPAFVGSAVAAEMFFLNTHDIALPFYANGKPKAIGVCRAKRVFEDYQRRGFFRIGLLPSAGVQDMTLEIRDVSLLPEVLEKASGFFGRTDKTKQVMEVHGFFLFFSSHSNAWVRAEQMQVENPAIWQLRTVTVGVPNAPSRSFRRATLLMKGARAGDFHCDNGEEKISTHLQSLISDASATPL